MTDSTFNNWDPQGFATDAQYQRCIRWYTSGHIEGDVLDVGCGSRIYCDLTKATSWTGLDVSDRMVSSIDFNDNVERRKIQIGDVREMPLESESFDTVTAFFLLHHLARKNKKASMDEVKKAYRDIFRVLKPGGKLIVAENCPGPAEAPYHALFSLLYPLAFCFFDTELPYFWSAKTHQSFASTAGFINPGGYVHVPIVESIFQPVIGKTTPSFLNGAWIQKMTVFVFEKPS